MQDADTQQRFIFENSNVRGILVHLKGGYRAARERYDYPDAVAEQLGQALAASCLLSATIKFQGSLILQIQSDGPVNMLVAQCTHDRHIRGLARWQQTPADDSLKGTFGNGQITITIAADRFEDRYQGIIALDGDSLGDAFENYFAHSEQLPTHLWLTADGEQAVGMLLQKLPNDGGIDEDPDYWSHIETLGATITNGEMLNLSTTEILHRLFHEEQIRLFDPEPVSFRCECSRDKIVTVIRSLGLQEARDIVSEQEQINVGCEFCNQQYNFDAVDVEEIFAGDTNPPAPSTRQ